MNTRPRVWWFVLIFFDEQAVLYTFVVLSPSLIKVNTKNKAALMCENMQTGQWPENIWYFKIWYSKIKMPKVWNFLKSKYAAAWCKSIQLKQLVLNNFQNYTNSRRTPPSELIHKELMFAFNQQKLLLFMICLARLFFMTKFKMYNLQTMTSS